MLKEQTGRHLGGEGVVTLSRGSRVTYLRVVSIKVRRTDMYLAENQGSGLYK